MESPNETVALAGNPNAGKTTLFNALCGASAKVGNYGGVTVEVKKGEFFTPHGRRLELIDLPGTFSLEGGFLNIVTPAYHWHLASDRIRVLRSHDTTHARSGRRVLFFELREQSEAAPFLRIYLHREKGVDFAPEILARFLEAHAALGEGLVLARESGSDPLTPSASVVPAP